MRVLGIESSCDESAASVVSEAGVLSEVVYSQAIHEEYGGVVPELAARAHVEKMGSVVKAALDRAGIERPDAVAATAGPGLIGAVLVGLCWGKAMAAGWGVPFLGVNHLEGHLLSPLLEDPAPQWPFLGLVVSGGHTTLYKCSGLGEYEILGTTVDDAAGEAFDKVARLMQLGYPGGPVIDKLAGTGDASAISFPRPRASGLDFSFSGLKTAVRTHVLSDACGSKEDICASFQAAVVDCLLTRIEEARRITGISRLALAGGVAANSELRDRAIKELEMDVFLPPRARCTDNAAMIANAGRMHLVSGRRDPFELRARPVWPLA